MGGKSAEFLVFCLRRLYIVLGCQLTILDVDISSIAKETGIRTAHPK